MSEHFPTVDTFRELRAALRNLEDRFTSLYTDTGDVSVRAAASLCALTVACLHSPALAEASLRQLGQVIEQASDASEPEAAEGAIH
ncbi:MAG: hypothetical protein AAF604_04765 [Acidobacteriota bacterium]